MIDHLLDLEADFRVFYRIDDFRSLDAASFFALAFRTPHYQGAMHNALTAILREENGGREVGTSGNTERDDLADLTFDGLLEVL